MALSLNPHELEQDIHLYSSALQPHSTPWKFTVVHDHETLSQSQPPMLASASNFGHVTHNEDIIKSQVSTPPAGSRVAPDLPTWTPLQASRTDEGLSASDLNIDGFSSGKGTDLAVKRHEGPPLAGAQAMVNDTVTIKSTPNSEEENPPKRKKARFNGVLIATKPPPYYRKPGPTGSRGLSLVDALARTFDANRHTENVLPRQFRKVSGQHDDAQTDAETTEVEDEHVHLNARLAHRPKLKRRLGRAVPVHASETASEDATSVSQEPPQAGRLVKRLKPIQYEANQASIDAALGTVQAPISWDAELDFIARDDDADWHAPSVVADVSVTDDAEGEYPSAHDPGDKGILPALAWKNEWHAATTSGDRTARAVLASYQSRGSGLRQRLHAAFGENATVRTDKVARPRPVDLDLYALDEPDRESSPYQSESTPSATSASAAEEEGAKALPSPSVTSQSPDVPSVDAGNLGHLPRDQLDTAVALTEPPGEEQMQAWVVALQRLVKGKVRIKEEDLEMLSIVLAEIESIKDGLNESMSMAKELRESVKQLSQLYEIPFGDRNKLRERAENILCTWPPMGQSVAP